MLKSNIFRFSKKKRINCPKVGYAGGGGGGGGGGLIEHSVNHLELTEKYG